MFSSLKGFTIDNLTKYYENVIQRNLGHVEKIRNVVFATSTPFSATNPKPEAKPIHSKSPVGKESWCFYNRELANKEVPGSRDINYKNTTKRNSFGKILPLY